MGLAGKHKYKHLDKKNKIMNKFTKNPQLTDIASEYEIVDNLVKGTAAMIAAGETYLPKEPKEPLSAYNIRLGNSVLAPFYKRTIAKAVGKALAKGINVVTNDSLAYLIDSVDGSGTSMETFAKQVIHSAINYGITYILTDAPIADQMNTLADMADIKPYFVEIKPTNVLDIKTDFVGSQLVLTYFRFMETVIDYKDLKTQVSITQVKEFLIDESGTVVCNTIRKDAQGKEILASSVEMIGFNRIPITPVYGNKIAPYIGSPLLIDLAYLNLKHYRKQSDADWSEHFSMTPILALSGFQPTVDENGGIQEFVLSANTSVILPNGGDVKWVQGDSSTMQQARESIKALEEQMEKFGIELTVQSQNGTETATGRIIDAAEANSVLKSIVIDLEWSLYNAILIAGDILGIDAVDTSVDIDKSFTVANNADITLLKDLFQAGILTLEEVRAELATRKIIMSESIKLN